MRPQQQNRRMRGRNNNNRKGPNPLTRNYESNGPDVKIRGSAQQIAEKYATLARDAQSAGDRVMAENYLQHAEHYNRIIAAAQAQMPIQQFQNNRDDFDDDLDEERDEQQPDNLSNQPPLVANGEGQPAFANGNSPQPVIDGTPAEVALNSEAMDNGGQPQPRGDRQNGFHNNGYNGGEENYPRRNRRSRRSRGRPDQEQQGGEGEQAQAEEGGASELPQQLMQPVARKETRVETPSGDAQAKTPAGDAPAAEAPASEPTNFAQE
jgi:hypothetical protein